MLLSQVSVLRFDHLCYGQWHAMVNLSPRLPVKQHDVAVIDTTEILIDKAKEDENKIKLPDRRNYFVTEKPDFEIVDEDYLL